MLRRSRRVQAVWFVELLVVQLYYVLYASLTSRLGHSTCAAAAPPRTPPQRLKADVVQYALQPESHDVRVWCCNSVTNCCRFLLAARSTVGYFSCTTFNWHFVQTPHQLTLSQMAKNYCKGGLDDCTHCAAPFEVLSAAASAYTL